ncbi:unnamed protein product, partial [Coregonus sp. 'balchen']
MVPACLPGPFPQPCTRTASSVFQADRLLWNAAYVQWELRSKVTENGSAAKNQVTEEIGRWPRCLAAMGEFDSVDIACTGGSSWKHSDINSVRDKMTTARYRPTWDLTLDPLVSCKLCLGEFPLEQMTTITQCRCVFCTLCLKQYVELLIKEGLETAISCPDSACPKRGHLLENEIECMVASEVMQRHKKLHSFYKSDDDDGPIKRCPKCKMYIERDEGCAQMMCKNCKHAFCWYCLESLDDDFLLIHFDKGPCRNKLGHSRSSVTWHRTQVVGIFAGFGLLLLVASPFLLLATPFILCCKCKCSKGDDDPFPT